MGRCKDPSDQNPFFDVSPRGSISTSFLCFPGSDRCDLRFRRGRLRAGIARGGGCNRATEIAAKRRKKRKKENERKITASTRTLWRERKNHLKYIRLTYPTAFF